MLAAYDSAHSQLIVTLANASSKRVLDRVAKLEGFSSDKATSHVSMWRTSATENHANVAPDFELALPGTLDIHVACESIATYIIHDVRVARTSRSLWSFPRLYSPSVDQAEREVAK